MQNTRSNKTQAEPANMASHQTGAKGVSMPAVPVLQQKTEGYADEQPEGIKTEYTPAFAPAQPFTPPIQKKPNDTGLPDDLKSGIENLSGFSMDDTRVHYNSPQPAQLNAFAYAQGSNIHIGPGQEKHLPHEAWHVVQQKQGRVQATMQMKGNVPVNDDAGLEHEADVMGAKALQMKAFIPGAKANPPANTLNAPVQFGKTVKEKEKPGKPYDRYPTKAEVARVISDNKEELLDGPVSDTEIRMLTRGYFDERDGKVNLDVNKAAESVASFINSTLRSEGGFHVPRSVVTSKEVNGITYIFYNDAEGCLDFEAPQTLDGVTGAVLPILLDINIEDPMNPDHLKNTGDKLRNSRANHFWVCNMIREGKAVGVPADKGLSPVGLTWHHHKDKGRMQLIDRDVHAAFAHRGGFAIWGA